MRYLRLRPRKVRFWTVAAVGIGRTGTDTDDGPAPLGKPYQRHGRPSDAQRVLVLREGRIVVVWSSFALRAGPGAIVPPTDAGWSRFLAAILVAIPTAMGWTLVDEGKW